MAVCSTLPGHSIVRLRGPLCREDAIRDANREANERVSMMPSLSASSSTPVSLAHPELHSQSTLHITASYFEDVIVIPRELAEIIEH
jgi:hypothetical protein